MVPLIIRFVTNSAAMQMQLDIRRKIKLAMILLLTVISASGQYNNLKFENISTINGLSSSTCIDIFQDSEGFLWFGTIDGLNKYDGYDFTVYRPVVDDIHSISNNRINAITEDAKGRLWIGTGNGLNVFDKNQQQFFRINHDPNNVNLISSNLINGLFFDKDSNTLWVATKNGVNKLVLDKFDPAKSETLKFIRYFSNPDDPETIDNNDVANIIKDNENKIWIGTSGKYLNRYDSRINKFERILIDVSNPRELNHLPKIIMIDHDGDFWIGNNLAGLIVWDRKKNIFSSRSLVDTNVPIFHLYQDKKGVIWVATDGHGIYFVDKRNGILKHLVNNPSDPFSISNNQPSRILEDDNGIIWIATYNTGINKLALTKSAFGHFFHQPGNNASLSTKIAQSVLQDRSGRIWIGTDGGGLNLFDEKSNSFLHYRSDPRNASSISSDKILYLCESYDGSIWVTTWDGGINNFNPQTKRSINFKHNSADPFSIGQNTVWCAVEDSLHRLWLATSTTGLNLLDRSTGRFYKYTHNPEDATSLQNNFVYALFIDSRKRLFVGTATGLSIVDLNTLKSNFPNQIRFANFKGKRFQGNRINYITEDHSGSIWLGTDIGIYKLSQDLDVLATYTTLQGLPNNLITGITEDNEGNIWITSKSGLSRLDPNTHTFKNFNIHDGLQGMEFQGKSIAKTKDGRILVGGINGFNIFKPETILLDSQKVRLLLTDFKIFNRSVKVNDTIQERIVLREPISKAKSLTLFHNENYLSFDYLALNYSNPENSEYAYRLEGLDPDWNYVRNKRNASYSNLAPGHYVFEVMVSQDGSWNKNKASINITILSPPWNTWWAYILYVVIIAMITWFAMRFYASRLREEKEHELDQMKLSFFINVSHEFRTPLTLILNPIDKILSASTNNDEVKTSALTIQRSARRLLNLVNQLLDFRKTDLGKAPLETVNGNIVKFSKDLFMLVSDLAAVKDINLRFESSVDSLNIWFDPDKLEKILTNLLSNAIKFTESGGEVVLSISVISDPRKTWFGKVMGKRDKQYVQLRVTDTGIGLKEDQLKNVFDRFFHVDNTKTGTGIGLHFTKSLVELHGGQITVESEYDKGSTFLVKLPIDERMSRHVKDVAQRSNLDQHQFDANAVKAMEYEVARTSAADNVGGEEMETANDRKPVLLVVEDNRELRVHLKNELRNQFKVREAANGVDGLEKVLKYYPDIIISDIMMPEMDGFELCRKIKTDVETSHIPVVLLTARSLEEDKIEGYQTGADEYLPKPFNMHVLRARLKNLLESRQRLKEKFMSAGGVLPAKDFTTNTLDEVFLDKVTKTILENISDPDFSLEQLLEKVGISRSHFFRKINSLTGQNPSYFIRTVRLKYASGLLLQRQHSIKEISYLAGFNSSAYFSKTFRELFGKTPQAFVEEHQEKQ